MSKRSADKEDFADIRESVRALCAKFPGEYWRALDRERGYPTDFVNALTQAGDINGVHMGVVLIATLAFGLITPPYGLVLLMASKFVGVSFGKALRAALPIYVVFLVTITFTIYFPKVVLWLPKHVIPESVGCFKSPAGTGYICPP